ncbi:MAG: NTP transferase domain-containing protein [Myxococcota bacterium]
MKAIIIGAGRGRRLGAFTEDVPKPLVPILGRPILDHILHALADSGLTATQTVFICGYRGDVIRARHPELTFVENRNWAHNNILLSLLCAREHLQDGFVATYADIVYRPEAVQRALASPHDITLVCDRAWRRRYAGRTEHPESDAEKVVFDGAGRITALSRTLRPEAATGEFIGVLRMTSAGVGRFLAAFDDQRATHRDEDPFHEGRTFGRAYLIDALAKMLAAGTPIHAATVDGGYMEIDTPQDAGLAAAWWDDDAAPSATATRVVDEVTSES